MRKPHGTEVDTVTTLDRLIPEEGNRRAVEDTDDDRLQGEQAVEYQYYAASQLHLLDGKDAKILQ